MGGTTFYLRSGGLRQELVNLNAAIEALESLAQQRLARQGIKRHSRARPAIGLPIRKL
jgi:hypothetical protein